MNSENIIVVGASAGGFEAIKTLVKGLPKDLPASVFIVWHMSPDVRGILPQVLNRFEMLPAAHAFDGEEIADGRIYVAPPDRHLVLEGGRMRVTRGPKENRFRPAVDPLFRSAAQSYGPNVIGIILSGALDDGSSGLWTVKQKGGIAVVQDPVDAEVPSMPENAIRGVAVDHILPIADIPHLLVKLVHDKERRAAMSEGSGNGLADKQLQIEVGIAAQDNALEAGIMEFGEFSPFACPDCHGVLSLLKEGNIVRYRCHTGHGYTADSLLASLTENIEKSLWDAIRGVDESIMLLNHMGDHFAESNQPKLASIFFRKAKEAEDRNAVVRSVVMAHEQFSADSLRHEIGTNGDQHDGRHDDRDGPSREADQASH
jgi:two-component system, chemotaxis family, protein-glutamate methylesterase/glutaminase